jgi:signal transduction histidine kinase
MTKLRAESKKLMDHIRTNVATLKREEEKLLFQRESKMKGTIKAIATVTVISLSLAFALLFFGFITYRKVSMQREISEKNKIEYQAQLKKRIEELDKVNIELIRMRSQEKFAATGRIARTIAHEIRNPLTNISLAADQLKAEVLPDDENASQLFEMINRNSNRINHLISDLLNATKFSELTYTKIHVNDLLDETLKEASDRISLNQVEVIKKYTTGVCDVSVDKERIKIAFLNIIINAVEAMENKEGSVLTLETKEENNKCQVIIRDNGSGLDNKALSRVFEPYFTSKPKGNGLGLTNTQNIILNHKGEISVESTNGKGVIFTITLNCAI